MDATEALWKAAKLDDFAPRGAFLKALQKDICEVASGRRFCTGKRPKAVSKKRKPGGDNFEPITEKDEQMEQLMNSMKDVPGMGGMQMFSREDLAEMYPPEERDSPEDSQAEFKKATGQDWGSIADEL